MRKWVSNTLLVVAIVIVFAIALFFGSRATTDDGEGFAGTDSAATAQIEKANPDYKPWFSSLFTP